MYRKYKLTSELEKTPFNRVSSYNLELVKQTAVELGLSTRFIVRYLLEQDQLLTGRIKKNEKYLYEIGFGFFMLLNKLRSKRGLAKFEITSQNEVAIRYA